ncbi:hypothetical protein CHELA40_13838 [Chelatococcus asaccharovorans]|nr:hypothetical protein CHELA40_13838 [Chelatococcus asaccharovorans]CAH1675281.1 hypothetical protein CHELA17_61789 [Chelatococcus asaccharovorans]
MLDLREWAEVSGVDAQPNFAAS